MVEKGNRQISTPPDSPEIRRFAQKVNPAKC